MIIKILINVKLNNKYIIKKHVDINLQCFNYFDQCLLFYQLIHQGKSILHIRNLYCKIKILFLPYAKFHGHDFNQSCKDFY